MLRLYLVKDCEVLIVNSLIKELKVELRYTQAILVQEGFPNLANDTIVVRLDAKT
jgi:hypothetical protein